MAGFILQKNTVKYVLNPIKTHIYSTKFKSSINICSLHFKRISIRNFSTWGRHKYSDSSSARPKLSPLEVTEILKTKESVIRLKDDVNTESESENISTINSITSVDSNQLASNTPIEDTLAAARCLYTTGFLFGVFDGHGGPECSQVISKRLFEYIAVALLPQDELKKVVQRWDAGETVPLIEVYNDPSNFVPELEEIYRKSLIQWGKELLSTRFHDFNMEKALCDAFVQLDKDIGAEVKENTDTEVFEPLLRIAVSGSVACVAHVDGPHLHVANTGDCGAILGIEAESSQGWIAKRLTVDHNWENSSEVNRVLSEHPSTESENVVQNQRLLGVLMPFRAFGDFRFKWDHELQSKLLVPYMGENAIIPHYETPPYLTCLPQITYHRLGSHNKFLVLGSDGLWEGINVLDVVLLVGEYMCGRQTLQPVRLPRRPVKLKEVLELLDQRQEGLKLKPVDTNASTHLIRHSLGGSDYGLDHSKISHSLMLPPEIRRFFRDDISIHVIFFDTEYLRTCPMDT